MLPVDEFICLNERTQRGLFGDREYPRGKRRGRQLITHPSIQREFEEEFEQSQIVPVSEE